MPAEITGWSRFPELAATLPYAVGKEIRKAAIDIQARAMITAPIKTGFLRSSIYVMSKEEQTYGQNLNGSGQLLPPVPVPTNETTAIVAVGAEYGVYIEYGTRYKPARPYLLPAAEFVKPKLEIALSHLEILWAAVGGV